MSMSIPTSSKEQIIGLTMDFKGISASSLISLDNGGYWKTGYTYLYRDKFLAIRNSLRTEMNVMNHQITELNNSPIYEGDNGSSSTKGKTG
ncbi:hypothetical protein [Brevibacillus laterosporus]|uniref:hypothetical protein n=1 Tax=Brevibacillus laterosporus TaxID=1465 RepID=UPI00131559BF|nr:hypothetical protein [Brevibacillus laterosporus]